MVCRLKKYYLRFERARFFLSVNTSSPLAYWTALSCRWSWTHLETSRLNISEDFHILPCTWSSPLQRRDQPFWGIYAASSGNSLPTFRTEYGTDTSRNVDKEVPLLAAQYPRRRQFSSTLRWKPEIALVDRNTFVHENFDAITYLFCILRWNFWCQSVCSATLILT